ncbi:MAG: hypothetical protein Q9164_003835 [Protoblastenia rupestris]
MPDSLNVVALISGGKDSFFSILHCLVNGHKMVALANLYPPALPPSKEAANDASEPMTSPESSALQRPGDMDSFMYQTAGHTLVPFYAHALGLPLYQHEITGSAVDSSKYYHFKAPETEVAPIGQVEEDETECLIPLLKKVIARHPEANAICSGAILSTYQRTRIESIAIRLGLIPLSYLWQYPYLPLPSPGGLLDDMAAVGFDVRIVKVASGGLSEDLLWCNLMDSLVRAKVQKAVKRFGGNVLGEGGEYETLLIDGPSPLWQRRIEVDESKMQRCVESGSDGNAFLRFGPNSGQVVRKEIKEKPEWIRSLRHIGHWDKKFGQLNQMLTERVKRLYSHSREDPAAFDLGLPMGSEWSVRFQRSKVGSLVYIANLISKKAGAAASEQMQSINHDLRAILSDMKRSTNDIVFTTILLRSIPSHFTSVNQIYGQLFDTPNPPARVTVSTSMPPGVNVIVCVVIDMASPEARDALHVQSRSYWAPANIGPYSQAISVRCHSKTSLVYVAGQIPLVPATMQVIQPCPADKTGNRYVDRLLRFQDQACLSLQHLWRIGTYASVGWWTGAVAYIAGGGDMQAKAHIAYETWKRVHERSFWEAAAEMVDDGLDVWDKMYGGLGSLAGDYQDPKIPPDYAMLMPGSIESHAPGFLAVQVDELPRGCEIEWQSLGVARGQVYFTPTNTKGCKAMNCNIPSANTNITYVSVQKPILGESPSFLNSTIQSVRDHVLACSGTDKIDASYSMTVYTPHVDLLKDIDVQVVPCRTVWGSLGPNLEKLAAGIIMHSDALLRGPIDFLTDAL